VPNSSTAEAWRRGEPAYLAGVAHVLARPLGVRLESTAVAGYLRPEGAGGQIVRRGSPLQPAMPASHGTDCPCAQAEAAVSVVDVEPAYVPAVALDTDLIVEFADGRAAKVQ
jgi:hypothetical protein